MADITKKAKKTLNKTKKRAIILSFLAFGGLSIGSLGFLPFLMKTWNTLQYNIVDFKHINRDNAAYELEFALSDFDAYKLNYQDLNVDFTLDKEGKQVVTSHKATYDDFSRSWKINSNYDGLNFGKRYYLKVYLDAKNQKRFAAKKVISFGENVVNFVDTPPAVRTINFETKTPSTASVSLKFADESANLEGKKVALEYYYVLKNQSNDLEDKLSDTHTHTSYVDSSVVKNGVAEFNLKNLYPGLDYRISAIRYIDKQNTSQIPLVPMQKIALDSEIDYKRQGNEAKKSLFEQTTGKIRVIAASLIDQNLSYQQKRMTITFQNLDPSVSLENKVIKMFYKNALTGKEFTTSGTFLSNLVTFDLKNLDPGSKYYITKFELDSAKVDFSDTFVKNFYTPAAIVDSKTQVGATYANIELTVVSVDDLTKTTAFLYLDNTAVIPPLAKFIKTEKENTYKINLTPKELTNATKYNLNRLVLQSQVPDSVFAKAKDGYNYFTIPWINQLEVASLKRNFVTSISDLKTFIKLEPRVTASKVEYTLGFGLDSSFLNDKNLVLHYYKKGDPSEKYVSRPAIAEGSEIRFELNEFSGSTTYKLDKITIEGYPDLAVAIKYDQNKKSDQGLNFDEFFTKYFVSKIDFAEITETSAKVNVVISGDFKNSIYKQSSNSQSFKAKLIFGQPGFTNLSKTIDINLASQDENFTLTQDELLFHFKLDNLDPKTKYKVADLEVIGKSNLFDLENIINLDAEFSTAFQRVKVLGSNFDQITEKTATANIYFDPVFNNFLNGLKFKAKFKDETNKIVAYPSNSYHEIKNNRLKVELVNLEPGKKYTFVGLESDPEQEKGLENLTFEYFDQKDQTKTILPPFFYTVPKIAAIKSEPKQDSSKITVDFGISDPNFGKRPNSSDKNAIIFVKNNATGATSSATAKILFKEQKNIAEFNLENLKKLSHHTITQILVDSQKINYSENLEDEKAAQRNFNTVATTASVVKVLQTKKEFNKIGLKLSFDPIKDNFIKNDQIQVALINKTDNSTAEATGTVSDSLVLDLEFTNNIKPGSEYTISKLTNLTKDKNIQTSVGFEFKKAENYSPDLSGDNKNEKIYSSLEVKSFSVLKNENETVKVKLEFTDAEKALLSTTKPTISLLLKNSQTNEILTATTQAKEEDGKITAEFSFENLERNQKYVLVSVNDFSSAAPQFHLNSDLSSEDKKSFYVNVDKIEVKNIVYSNIKSTSVKAEIFFDPIKDHYLAEKEIEVEITKDEDPAAKFVSVATQVQGTPITRKKVKIIKLDDNRLRAEVEFENLDEGTDFKIKLLKLAKNAIHTNNKNVETGPKFEIVDEFVSSVAASSPDKKIGQIDDNSKQKTLKFATDIVISDIKINENNSSDKQRSAEIKIDFTNSNNEILKLKKDQVVTITLINKQTGKLILTSAKVVAEESTQGNKKTAASATFNFQNNLDKLTKYEISSVSVVRRNGVYPIPFSTKISQEKKSFSTQINSVTVKNIFYRDISKTSVELTTVFDFIEDNILNDQFEAELEYELEKPQGQNSILKTSKVEITNNRAIFIIENLMKQLVIKSKI
ncbi:hypothetical protein [Mycoplasma sp. 'Moose RK']|uniref:hypothetical protein n=1 Tax=Mycoplasma sp. 'Moose RK' TaxID=2780095 RepID=UPI0018C205D6|nr:hypothetical protein [Mycoplasma sp. 'Moose RK']MBG0731104.1 hypothetical protein [Mycoplasma sp. 'Moose RK']